MENSQPPVDFMAEIPARVTASDLPHRMPEQWSLGEALADQEFEFAASVGSPPSDQREAIELVRVTVRRVMDGWRVTLAQETDVQTASSPWGDDFLAAIGIALGRRLTILFADHLRTPRAPRAQASREKKVVPASPGVVVAAYTCDVCGSQASTVSVVPAGVASPDNVTMDFMTDSTRVNSDYFGETQEAIDEKVADQLSAVLRTSDARALFQASRPLAQFYCPLCDRSYCREDMMHADHLAHTAQLGFTR